MADNQFRVTLTATDKATEVVDKLKTKFAAATRPLDEIGAKTKALGKEIGADILGDRFGDLAKQVGKAGERISAFDGAMAIVTSAASIAGIAEMADRWGRIGTEITNAAARAGMAPGRFHAFGQAAKDAGLPVEAMNAGLINLGNTMEDAIAGRNPMAVAALHQLGISIHHTKDGAIDAERALRDMADAIASQRSPQVQNKIASLFGLDELLPMLRQGSAGIDNYLAKIRAVGAAMSDPQIQRAAKLGQDLRDLGAAFDGVGNIIADRFAAKLPPAIEQITKLIEKDKELIASLGGVGAVLGAVGAWKSASAAGSWFRGTPGAAAGPGLGSWALMGGVLMQPDMIDRPGVVDAVKRRIEENKHKTWQERFIPGYEWLERMTQGPEGARVTVPLAPLPDKSGDGGGSGGAPGSQAARAMAYFMSTGHWTREQAAGIVAREARESSFRADVPGDFDPVTGQNKSFGAFQWDRNRQADFARWAGHDIHDKPDLDEQNRFVDFELTQGKEQGAGWALHGAQTPEQAGAVVSSLYARPRDAAGEAAATAALARQVLEQTVKVEVILGNAPAGTTVKATSSTGEDVPVRVVRGMDGPS